MNGLGVGEGEGQRGGSRGASTGGGKGGGGGADACEEPPKLGDCVREPDCNHIHDVGRGDNLLCDRVQVSAFPMIARELLQVGNDLTSGSDWRMHG